LNFFKTRKKIEHKDSKYNGRVCRRIVLTLVAVVIFFGFVCLNTVHAAGLTIACYKDYRPYSYVNDKGEVVGVLVDFWTLWAEKNQIELTFLPGSLTQSLDRIKMDEADIMIGLFRSKDRAAHLDFSHPMIDIKTNLYVVEKIEADSIESLGNTPVGVIKNDYAVEYLSQKYPDVQIKTFPGSKQVVENALAGKLSAYALDFPNAIFLLAGHDSLIKFRRVQTLYTEKLRAGVKKGNTQLLKLINPGIKGTSKQEVETILSKWGLSPPPLIVQYRGWIMGVILVLLTASIGFAFYSMRLKYRMGRQRSGKMPFKKEEWFSLISQGEHDRLEFKSSMRWNLVTLKTDKVLEYVIVKTISAFMNAQGGTLLIGVNDDGEVIGIESDYQTFQKKPDRDGFMLKLSSLISQNMGRQIHKFISTQIQSIDGKDICRISITPGDRPVFIKENGKEAFYIRAGAASVPLSLSESHKYIRSRW
jgi:ABC-type amino acid transport substrate-binding protein